jgi:chlorophyll synthase
MLGGHIPSSAVILIAVLYSVGAHGIMTLNDFKSIEGDRQIGIKSLPAQLGAERAAYVACAVMLIPQLIVIALLTSWQSYWQAAAIAALVSGQLLAMGHMLKAPKERAPWYNGTGVSAYVTGMMIAATALPGITL